MKILLIDNYDSFTYNLYDYFCQLKATCRVIRNDEYSLEQLAGFHFDAVVISPGPKTPEYAGITMSVIDRYHKELPVLGICLGMQAIGQYFGATLHKASLPMHGKTSVIHHQGHPIFHNLPSRFEVMRYHSLILQNIEQTPLQCIAYTSDEEVMAVVHPDLPVAGVQFHPESILTQFGLDMLKNWMKWCSSKISLN